MRKKLRVAMVIVSTGAAFTTWALANDTILHPTDGTDVLDTTAKVACQGTTSETSGMYLEARRESDWLLEASANPTGSPIWTADLLRPGDQWPDGAAWIELYWTTNWQDEVNISFYPSGGGG